MQRHFQLSPPSVHQMVLTLERLGPSAASQASRAASRCSSPPKTCPWRHSKAPQSGTRPQPTVARLRSLQRDCVGLANDGQDTRALQQYLGHKNIQRTVRYTELAADRFKSFWENEA